ncbi:MAG TPA: phosphatase PAP2 family protein, partial [Terriglobales bacterium]
MSSLIAVASAQVNETSPGRSSATGSNSAGPSQTATSEEGSTSTKSVSRDSVYENNDNQVATAAPLGFLRNFADDQRTLWTSPFKARIQDLNWLVPMAGVTVGLMNADAELSSRISGTGTFTKHSSAAADAGLAVLEGGTGSLYLLGKWKGDEHEQETGILAGEAALNSLVITETFQVLTRRQRPTDAAGLGLFGKGPTFNSSFPSLHAALSWSAASVLAHEYPGVLTQVLSYTLASGVSLARVTGKAHFPSDVAVGSAIGWLVGQQVYAAHHDAVLGGGGYGTFERALPSEGGSTENLSSAYVPMDSWVYPAFERLGGLGVINSGFFGLRPWTRRECARLLEEAADSVDESSPQVDEGSRLYAALAREFAPELSGDQSEYISLDSLYAGVTNISGKPLTDGYHFGQTIVNNFGRPYQQGVNSQDGFSASGSSGALGFYIRGEFEHAPSAPGVSQAVQNAIQLGDAKTTNDAEAGPPIPQTASPIASFDQFRLLDTYLMLNINGWQTSFGKQT